MDVRHYSHRVNRLFQLLKIAEDVYSEISVGILNAGLDSNFELYDALSRDRFEQHKVVEKAMRDYVTARRREDRIKKRA